MIHPDSLCHPYQVVEHITSNKNPFSGSDQNFNIVCGYFEFEENAQFHHLIGVTPMKYLHAQRMLLAKQLIEQSSQTLMTISEKVGYQSDSTFKKTFKFFFNQAPASLRTNRK